MNWFALSCLLTSLAAFLQGFLVIYKNFHSKLNRKWFLFSTAVGVWSLCLFGVVMSEVYIEAMLIQYILNLSVVFIAIFYFQFVITLLNLEKEKRKVVWLFYFIGFLLIIISPSSLFVEGMSVNQYDFNYWINPGPLYLTLPVFCSLLTSYAVYLMVVNYKKFKGALRNQIKYIAIAGIIGFGGGVTNFFPQFFNIYPIGNYFVILYIVLVTYAILRYRLLSIRVIVSKFYFYLAMALFAQTFFYLAVFLNNRYMGGVYSFSSIGSGIILAIIFSIIFVPFLNYIQDLGDVLFFKGYNPRKVIKDLTIKLNKVINIKQLLILLNREFKKILGAEKISVLILEQDLNNKIIFSKENSLNFIKLKDNSPFYKLKHILIRDEMDRDKNNKFIPKFINEFDEHHIRVAAPLISRKKLVGIIFLHEKISGNGYAQEDIEFLEIISSQVAIAIENATLYEEVKDFNETLQKKVDIQTNEIKKKAESLEKLLKMRSEFLDIASHQLRTPISVIKGVLSMIEEDVIPEKKKDELLDAAFQKSIKLEEVIDEILRASELDSGDFKLHLRPVLLKEIFEDIYEDKKMIAKQKRIKLSFPNKDKIDLKVKSDYQYLRHIIRNLVNNAFQYTNKGSVTVTTKREKNRVVIRVADTGIGIPQKDRTKLFQKFSRAKNAVNTYTDGSGLGLFVAKKVVEAHPGAKICLEKTEVDKGSVFALSLPLAR